MDLLILIAGIVLVVIGRKKSSIQANKAKTFTVIGAILIAISLMLFIFAFFQGFRESFSKAYKKSSEDASQKRQMQHNQ